MLIQSSKARCISVNLMVKQIQSQSYDVDVNLSNHLKAGKKIGSCLVNQIGCCYAAYMQFIYFLIPMNFISFL